jgi:hypothetical protein
LLTVLRIMVLAPVQQRLEFWLIPDDVPVRFSLEVHLVAVAGVDGLLERFEGLDDVAILDILLGPGSGQDGRTDGATTREIDKSAGVFRQLVRTDSAMAAASRWLPTRARLQWLVWHDALTPRVAEVPQGPTISWPRRRCPAWR